MPVAIKCLKSEYPSVGDLARLKHEYAVLSDIDLRGVVKAVALERHGNGLALVLEDIGGESLDRVMRSERLTVRAALQIGVAVAHALAGLHQRHVIHKDIKPHNILVNTATGQVALIDFGISTRLSHETQRARGLQSLEGTLAYMSPEQTGRMNRVVDHRSDLYSLGVTLYEALTGRLPFQSTNAIDLVHSHIARRPTPPHELAPEIPVAVSNIVMKLLAKMAEDRYQHAAGLAADLGHCIAELDEKGSVAPFPLGRQDLSEELRIPQKLYGRDAELRTLAACFDRIADGSAELLLVAGYAGVGKSVLVNEIHKSLARGRGHLIAGKFDQLSRTTPYAPIAHAFRDLVLQILAEDAAVREKWKSSLLDALGTNAQLIVDLIPELEELIGAQPPVQTLGPTESQNRFGFVFQSFLRAFSTREHPLVLFLDDLQWADPASLKLIQSLITDPDGGYLLLIGAYRDNEVDAGHPLALALEELHETRATVSTITVKPLELGDVTQLVADALASDRARVRPIAELVQDRTHGNPFFIVQLLATLSQDGHVRFDAGSGTWTWELDALRQALSTDDVVELVTGRLRRLPPETRRTLQLAACIGHRFGLRALATICETSMAAVAESLWPALHEGLVLPLDAEYRFAHVAGGGDSSTEDFDVSYRFLHDRAQDAAYSLIAENERPAIHLRIGRLMRSSGYRHDDVFEVVRHLNLGAEHITDREERLEVARMNLTAARRAKAATAYEAAATHLAAGLTLVGAGAWETDYDLIFALYSERAECEALARRVETADALFETLLEHARTRLERAQVLDLQINLYTTLGKIPEAQALGKQALGLFGVDLPDTDEARNGALGAALAAIPRNLAGRRIEDLATADELADPDQQMIQTLITSLFPSTFLTHSVLYGAMIVRHVNLSLEFGQSPASAVGYMSYGYFIAGVLGQYEDARKFGELALALCERFGTVEVRAKLYFLFGAYSHFVFPLDEALEHHALSRHHGFEVGDFQYLSYTTYCTFMNRLGRGDPLGSVRDEVEGFFALMRRTKDDLSTLFLTVCRQVVANLEGRTPDPLGLSNENFDEEAFSQQLAAVGNVFVACFLWTYKAQIAFMRGEYTAALRYSDQAEEVIGSAAGLFFTTELEYYACLTRAALYGDADEETRAAYLQKIAAHQERFAIWSRHCPTTFEHKRLLVAAEVARVEGRELEAMALYDQAIETARRNEFVRDEALANELCARFHAERGRANVARAYVTDAYYGYLRWGVSPKVAALAEAHPHLENARAPERVMPSLAGTTSKTRAMSSGVLDVATIVAAAHALSGELVLDRLLERLMRLVLESAGAERGVFLLAREGQLRVAATITVDPDEVRAGIDVPIQSAKDLPRTIIERVARKREPIVLGHAARDPGFGADPHVAEKRVGSLACLPMLRQGRLAGVLYLENNLALDAFTPARNELLQTLSSLAATAVENALLYADLESATEELRRTNETLEQQVSERTAELRRAMAELWSEMDVARKIQTVLLPAQPELEGYEVAAMMQPAAHVGGDYYDVFRAGGRDWLLVGDVSGHGVPAGLVMMMVQTAVRATVLSPSGDSLTPSRMLAGVNAALRSNFEKMGKDQYMTITAFCFDGNAVSYAGLHEDILVYRAKRREVERIETSGVWLGVVDEIGNLLRDESLRLERDDVMLLVTDGVTEARQNGEMLGFEGLSRLFAEVAASTTSPSAIVDGVLGKLESFTKADDVTMVVARRSVEASNANG